MEKILVSELMELTKANAEERLRMYRNPKVVQVAMIVDLDEYGRIRGYSYPSMDEVLSKCLVDDSSWPFIRGEKVYHKTLKQVGTFIEVDELDPSSAAVEFMEEDGYREEKRVSLVLLTSEIPEDHNRRHATFEVNGVNFHIMKINNMGTLQVCSEDEKVDVRVTATYSIFGKGAKRYKSEILSAVHAYEELFRHQENE